MKSAIIKRTYRYSFEKVYNSLKSNIVSSDFLLLHEINTQAIVAKHDVKIRPLKQLLFFHPKYIERITNTDELAINEIPIKIVVSEKEDGSISVSVPNPVVNLSDYDVDEGMAKELLEVITTVLEI